MVRNIKIEQPKSASSLNVVNFQEIYDDDERYINACMIKDATINGNIEGHIEFSQVIFKNVNFNHVSFENIVLTDVVFENCDLSNAMFMDGNLHRVKFKECKMLGIHLAEANFVDVLFEYCNLNLSAFGYARLKHVAFHGCSMQTSDCYECKFTKVAFDKCELDQANFSGTPLKGIDLSSSTFGNLTVTIEDLHGCKVSSDQAIGFSKLLGLVIKE